MKRGQYWWKQNLSARKEVTWLSCLYADTCLSRDATNGCLQDVANRIEKAVEEALKTNPKGVRTVSVDLPAYLVLDIRKATAPTCWEQGAK